MSQSSLIAFNISDPVSTAHILKHVCVNDIQLIWDTVVFQCTNTGRILGVWVKLIGVTYVRGTW